MIHLDIEFSGMIAFDLRKNKAKEKYALLLPGDDLTEPHLPVLALPRTAVKSLPRALRRPNGWPQGLEYGRTEQVLLDLTGLDLLVKGATNTTTPTLDRVWALKELNRLGGGNGAIQCGAEIARVVMTGGLLDQGKPYPPFDKAKFALTTGGPALPNTLRSLTNTMQWSGDLNSLSVRGAYGDLGQIEFNKAKVGTTTVQAAVYCLVATSGLERDSLEDFRSFYSLLSTKPPKRAYPVQIPRPPLVIQGYPRCIPPVMIL